jgi:hypothetical protein
MGEAATELQMRVALHSGSVTGPHACTPRTSNVLCNPVSAQSSTRRWETHISQVTADEMLHDWVTSRYDKVIAKDKGDVQT